MKLIKEEHFRESGKIEYFLIFIYDINGRPLILEKYSFDHTLQERYYYLVNQLNKVVGLINEDGELEVQYGYSPYGEIEVLFDKSRNSISKINPFRYKCYYYDEETQLFYCNSRYYSPELCRWISPDSIEYLDSKSINRLNLYCYCANNPIMYVDPSGHAFIAALLISMGIAALIGGATAGYSAYQSGERGWDLVADIAGGAIFGAMVGATIALGGAAGLTAT